VYFSIRANDHIFMFACSERAEPYQRDAIKHGDVGHMEDLLPTLLFQFSGGGNPEYTIEILELLQGLRREWPEDVS
jgi:hypothetical protein